MIEEGNRRLYVNVNDLRKKNPARAAKYYTFNLFIFSFYFFLDIS